MKKVSIIIPIYNAEKTINRCVDSLIKQTHENLEVILLNDGSTDDTDKLIKEYKDTRIKYIKKDNTGIGDSRNIGIDSSTGDYIMFMDSDDYIEEDCVETLVQKLESDACDMVISDYFIESTHQIEVHIPFEDTTSLESTPTMVTKVNLAPWNKLYKRELFTEKDNKFPLGIKYEDAPVVIQAMLDSGLIGFIKKCLYHYVIEPTGETFTRDERIFDIIKICKIIEEKVDKYEYINKTNLIVKILIYYIKNSRFIKDNDLRTRFINEVFSYLNGLNPKWRTCSYLKGELNLIRRIVLTHKITLKMLYALKK